MKFSMMPFVVILGLVVGGAATAHATTEVVWLTKLDDAIATAKKLGRPVVIEEKRATCGNCQAMAKSVLVDGAIRSTLARDFVCLEVDTDHAPFDIDAILRDVHGVGNKYTLPCFVYVTPEGKIIRSTNGFRSVVAFKSDLQAALSSDAMRSPADVEKKLAEAADAATKEFDAKKFGAVIRAAREADGAPGWCDGKVRLRALHDRCEEAATQALEKAAGLAQKGNFDGAKAAVEKLQTDFAGSDTAERGAQAALTSLERLVVAAQANASGDSASARMVYEAIVKDAAGTPYEAIAWERLAKLPK
ncbi:MAG: DUF255 domain-containing protein [Planctomycetes bacterium]|nr:DUF255 domain-containing protein [Planctomycetota bacterium]MBI3847245.1 DUF255 domain-containing protein [Planctomycetota bacterium]